VRFSPKSIPGPAADRIPPSRVRHRVIGFAVTLAAITYVDRVCISA
jgi:hypothetical protein